MNKRTIRLFCLTPLIALILVACGQKDSAPSTAVAHKSDNPASTTSHGSDQLCRNLAHAIKHLDAIPTQKHLDQCADYFKAQHIDVSGQHDKVPTTK